MDYFVIGAGLTGLATARTLADLGNSVTIFEKLSFVGGNVREVEVNGSLVHEHGPHFFHTNSEKVMDFVKRFSVWQSYEHRVAARTADGIQVPLPICGESIAVLRPEDHRQLGESLQQAFRGKSETTILALLDSDVADVRRFGELIFDSFYKGYSEKQWGFDPFNLDRSVLSRVPVRLDNDSRYFTDMFQAIPKFGYNSLVESIAQNKNIRIEFNSNPKLSDFRSSQKVISTAPLDEMLEYQFGPLPYRSLRFEFADASTGREHFDHVQTNFSNSREFTRAVNYQLFYKLVGHGKSDLVAYEFAQEFVPGLNHRYYPVLTEQSKNSYREYSELLQRRYPNVFSAGRLGDFRYYNMDQAIARGMQIGNLMANS